MNLLVSEQYIDSVIHGATMKVTALNICVVVTWPVPLSQDSVKQQLLTKCPGSTQTQ